jgi:hypothetical protein
MVKLNLSAFKRGLEAFFKRVQPRDVIAFGSLAAIFILIGLGHDSWLEGIGGVIIAYYFLGRVNEESSKK